MLFTFCTDANQFHSFAFNKLEGFVDISNFMESHFSSVGFGELFSRNYFEEKHKLKSIAEVFFDVLDLCSGFSQMRITPGRKSLKYIIKSYLRST